MADTKPAVALLAPFVAVGRFIIALFASVGRVALFAARTLARVVVPPYYPARFFEQLAHIGWFSLPVVGLSRRWDRQDARIQSNISNPHKGKLCW